jgi:CheY-like chemotaxis protein
MLRLLIVEDQVSDAELALRHLRAGGVECTSERVETQDELREALLRQRPDLVLSDGLLRAGFDGLTALAIVRAETPGVPFILLSGAPWDYKAQEAIAAGATDYVCKADLRALVPAVRRALGIPGS